MNILIDVDRLQAEGVLTPELADKLRAVAVQRTASAALNALFAFGAFSVAIGLCIYFQSARFAAGLGLVIYFAGVFARQSPTGRKLGGVGTVAGALTFAGASAILLERPLESSLLVAVILFAAGLHGRSRLLLALTPLALAGAIGGSAGYWDACYEVTVREPTLTIALFSLLAAIALAISKQVAAKDAPLALAFARMSLIIVNFGFWIGSLWGDRPGNLWRAGPVATYEATIPKLVFVFAWIVGLVAVGVWGARSGRRFLVNVAIVFGGVEFYTQVFERWGAEPLSLIVGGVLTIAIGLVLWSYNRRSLT